MLDSKTSIEMQKVLKQLMGNPKEIESFKKEPDAFLKRMDIEFNQDLKLEVIGILGYLGYCDDEFRCGNEPIQWRFPIPRWWRRYIDGWCGNEIPFPRPWPYPWLYKPDPTPWGYAISSYRDDGDWCGTMLDLQRWLEWFKNHPPKEPFPKPIWSDLKVIDLIKRLTVNQKEFEAFKSKPESFLKEYGIDANQVITDHITTFVNNQM